MFLKCKKLVPLADYFTLTSPSYSHKDCIFFILAMFTYQDVPFLQFEIQNIFFCGLLAPKRNLLYIFVGEIAAPREDLHRYGENMQTPHRKTHLAWDSNSVPSCCEAQMHQIMYFWGRSANCMTLGLTGL